MRPPAATAVPRVPSRGGYWSLGTKLALVTVVIVALAAATISWVLTVREQDGLVHAKQRGGELVLRVFALSAQAPLEFQDQASAQELIDRVARDDEIVEATAWAVDGQAVAHFSRSGAPASPWSSVAGLPDHVLGERDLRLSASVTGLGGERLGTVALRYSLARERAEFVEIRRLLLGWASACGLAVVGLLLAASRRVVIAPLRRIEVATVALRGGDRVSVDIEANDELGRVARAFNAMAEAIAEREDRLQATTRELQGLLDHMRQAIFTIEVDGTLGSRWSREAVRLFGREDLAGAPALALLLEEQDPASIEVEALRTWLEVLFVLPEARWDEVSALAPQEWTLRPLSEDPRELRLEVRPYFAAGRVERVLVLATDETETRRREREAAARQSAAEREAAGMRRIVAGGTHTFVSFLRTAQSRAGRIDELLHSAAPTLAIAEEIFRYAHTIKGEARVFGLDALEGHAAALEDGLSRARRPDAEVLVWPPEVSAGLAGIGAALVQARQRLVEASPLGEEVLDRTTVSADDLERVVELAARASDPALRRGVERLAARPFVECAAGSAELAATWAAARGKRARVEVRGGNVRVPAGAARLLGGCLAHLVRNAVAHGIEGPAERRARGKDETGTVVMAAREDGAVVEITVTDDGAGLDEVALHQRARALGVAEGLAGEELPFVEGLSRHQHADDLSGRGVGLAAVRADLAHVGATATLSRPPAGGVAVTIRIAVA